ncbi:Hypothetical predicted protein [Olea europaea subsp. europaea]|uniref:Uncharacterized protein n=1 Tax=Olea europaea subsp. europaea TaxID=158383 RepID=A0A8S0V8C7_OLEEU|nr:Hypothetical predicted protein [Olea europaea subsp. europaea]
MEGCCLTVVLVMVIEKVVVAAMEKEVALTMVMAMTICDCCGGDVVEIDGNAIIPRQQPPIDPVQVAAYINPTPIHYHGHHNGYNSYKVKAEILIFNGSLEMEAFIDWLNEAERFLKSWRSVKNIRLQLLRTNLREEQEPGGEVFLLNITG